MPECEGPCDNYSDDLLACRDPAGNVKELCEDCREEFEGVDIVEPMTDGGIDVTWDDLSVNQKRTLRVLDEAEEAVLGSGDIVSRVEQRMRGSKGHVIGALGRLRAMGLAEELAPNEYRITGAGEELLRSYEQNKAGSELVADGGIETLYYPRGAGSSGAGRTLHVDKDCRYLSRAESVAECSASNPPRGEICGVCGEDVSREDLTTESSTRTPSGRSYTKPTGEDYLGVWKSRDGGVEVSIGTFEQFDWGPDTAVAAVRAETGVALTHGDDVESADDVLAQLVVKKSATGIVVSVSAGVARQIPGFEGSGDVRGYERDGRILLVDAATDPTLDEREAVTDGGRDTCVNCGGELPEEIEEATGVYCPKCGHGQMVPDGGHPMDTDDEPGDPAALADAGRVDEAIEAAYEWGKRDARDETGGDE